MTTREEVSMVTRFRTLSPLLTNLTKNNIAKEPSRSGPAPFDPGVADHLYTISYAFDEAEAAIFVTILFITTQFSPHEIGVSTPLGLVMTVAQRYGANSRRVASKYDVNKQSIFIA
ncbi:hypothetical protein TNCV_620971 [Trichonephila clavipes]|nr:hypothetical protein TNCV_620971 [Trichonephila clavipes]